ncbi:MAG: FAD-dependent oxidoreductase [Actinophytocola sp.]|uniref:FAD-dependent monooxygenase n=1 Tax=Actinophytocola sp. TaxID=1872138 RepID=UPI0013223FFF|nr:FAD-dependent oxidoreductase [Actinophytocola sp.]
MDYRGLHERLSGAAEPPIRMPGFQFGALPLDLSTLDSHDLFVLPIPQRRLEELLEDRARSLGILVRRGQEVTTVRQGSDEVTAEVRGPEGTYEVSARYLVGADGGQSVVRKQSGIDFPGITDEDMPLAELRDAVKRVLGAELPMSEPPGAHPALRRTAGINSRQADRYRQGRVFLVGDAAHVHSGVGGPGLNLGLQDVLNLGWKLAAAVHGWAPPGLLDTYEAERHPVGERVIMHTRAQLALLQPGPNTTALRELMTELLADQGNRRHLADLMAGADIRYGTTDTHPMAGRWMPDLALRDGSRVAELLRPGRPVLLDLGAGVAAATWTEWADRVDTVVTTADTPVKAVLIRPDGYVAWATNGSTDGGTDGLREALTEWFGQAGPRRSLTR